MKKNGPVKLFVNSRIMVDGSYFREANPNYAKASIDESNKKSSSSDDWDYFGDEDDSEKSSDSVKSNGMKYQPKCSCLCVLTNVGVLPVN
jgi:hypothetical protein